jgi:uncharacterized membrane protein
MFLRRSTMDRLPMRRLNFMYGTAVRATRGVRKPPASEADVMLATLRSTSLVAATVTMGLLAGLFFTFAMSVMPGLGRTDNRVFVDAMQQINVAILNPWLAVILAGPPVFSIITAVLHFQAGQRATVVWIGAALALYVIALLITIGINVPLNDALAAAGPPQRITDPAMVRDHFETTWARWNIARTGASTAAFVLLCIVR